MANEQYTIVGFNIGRPFDHSLFAPDLTAIYKLCHSRKIINRALILYKGDSSEEREEEEKKKRKGKGRILSSSITAGALPAA
ncbi:hypothetical protein MA16_Dca029091 [Dendrobium catenatum]|uniref:Uncharacterized protein n=1 Tax=Dendrobium catenatum TaxID=906689 RepID=A0A2I0V6J1_9ASPA|nr:hypothetical protein MA16_Dca029091 [Dendrobium catenatum]